MVSRSAGSVPSAVSSYSKRSVLGRPMFNYSWIHIWSRRGHPRRIASLLVGLVTAEHIPLYVAARTTLPPADLGHLLKGCVSNPLSLGDQAPRHGVSR
jgi:hypothetical protein